MKRFFSKIGLSVVLLLFVVEGAFAAETIIGDIDSSNFIDRIFQATLGVAVGAAIIKIMLSGLKIATAAGNPDSIMEGREEITSAFIGLGVVILSVFILNLLGQDILGLGNFLDLANF